MPGAKSKDSRALADRLACAARRLGDRQVQLMEVCGTHTMAIARGGIRSILPGNVRLVSGPGCPVCVTPAGFVDGACEIAARGAAVVTYGDMLKVPGTDGHSLEKAKALGADVRVVYSPMEALALARREPSRKVVFLGIGFETTTPGTATLLVDAERDGVANLFVLSAHKLIPPAMRLLCGDPETRIDGYICPGHVSVIIGSAPYEALAREFSVPCAIAGFEPVDVLEAVVELLEMIADAEARVRNLYSAVVRPEGNPRARERIDEAFEPRDAGWRGLGVIPESGLELSSRFSAFDARSAFGVSMEGGRDDPRCGCGRVVKGAMPPQQCPLFARVCTPASPVGSCMVST